MKTGAIHSAAVLRGLNARDPTAQAAVPSIKLLSSLLDAAFFASIAQEEGEFVSFDLCYLPSPTSDGKALLRKAGINPELVLTVENIRKLGPVVKSGKVLLAIHQSEKDGSKASIWGFVQAKTGAETLPFFVIASRRPGVITVKYARQDIFHFNRGYISFAFAGSPIDRKVLRQLLCDWLPLVHLPLADQRHAANLLLSVASRALERGGGGTLVIVPSDRASAGGRSHRPSRVLVLLVLD